MEGLSVSKEQREHKETKTRPLKQEIENLKMDLMEAQEVNDLLTSKLQKMVGLLYEALPFVTDKLKKDIEILLKKSKGLK